MHPSTVIMGILFGSLFSIAFSLAGVLLIFWILLDDNPRFGAEMPELARATLIFSVLAAAAAFSFVGILKKLQWRHFPLAILVAGLAGTAYYYWPA